MGVGLRARRAGVAGMRAVVVHTIARPASKTGNQVGPKARRHGAAHTRIVAAQGLLPRASTTATSNSRAGGTTGPRIRRLGAARMRFAAAELEPWTHLIQCGVTVGR